MDYIYSIAAGLIQGLTEFLPISSSAHLFFFHEIFGFDFADNLFFDVSLHVATLTALVIYFRRDISVVISSVLRFLSRPDLKNDREQRLSFLMLIGSLPILILGFFFYRFIETTLRAVEVALPALFLVSLVFFLAEKVSSRSKTLDNMTTADAVIIGAAQALALIPGFSRSGITVCAGLFRKLNRAQAARFSFLISIPAVFGAAVKSAMKIKNVASVDWLVLACGFLAAMASGLLAIGFFLRFVERHPLHLFAWYRIALSAVLLAYFLFLS